MSQRDFSRTLLDRNTLLLAVCWTVVLALLLAFFAREERDNLDELILGEGRAVFARDLFYRRWNAAHGGVYVPLSEAGTPDPYLAYLPERDVTTASGRRLTLVHPDAMVREVMAMAGATE